MKCPAAPISARARGWLLREVAAMYFGLKREKAVIVNFIPFLILFPFVMALITALVRDDRWRGYAVYAGSVLTMGIAFAVVVGWTASGREPISLYVETGLVDHVILLGELALMFLVVFLSVKHGKYPIALLSAAQTLGIVWLEMFSGVELEEGAHLYVDQLSIILLVIAAVVGGLIVIYAVGYMRGYHEHHKEFADRRGVFFPLLFVFLGAMFGLILSASMTWMYFFWEITSVCSFLLIGYTRTGEARHNSFRALWMNLLGGLGYAAGIIGFALTHGSVSLSALVESGVSGDAVSAACVALLAFAALTKSAQMPFSQWLLGAMVAPTPTSALLHSATMVKAGVYLLMRLAPAMSGNFSGSVIAFVGGFTFFMSSLMAISQSDGKKVLAYSTISNLGLITACAGVGAAETVWAGLFLIIFHAVSKSMLFQSVGAVENAIGSRDIEHMNGLILRLPWLACIMIIGICGMFLAPFGMLVSKWAALKAFVDAGGLLGTVLVLFVCFGSATTLLYWSKWLSKILALNHTHHVPDKTQTNEYVSLFVHAAVLLCLCAAFPVLSSEIVQPIIQEMYGTLDSTISTGNLMIMVVMLLCVFVFPAFLFLFSKGLKRHKVMNYMAGVNTGDGRHFIDAMGEERELKLSAWYMENWFGEDKLMGISLAVASLAIVMMMAVLMGGVFA